MELSKEKQSSVASAARWELEEMDGKVDMEYVWPYNFHLGRANSKT